MKGATLRFLKQFPPLRVLREARGSFLRARARRLDGSRFHEFVRFIRVNDLFDHPQIRVGNKQGDGGYVISHLPKEFVGVVLSYGVNDDVSFEMDLGSIYREIPIHLFDHTVESPPGLGPFLTFHKEGIAAVKSRDLDTLASHIHQFASGDQWVFLKMDVEGSEYEALLGAGESDLKRISQIALELHGVSKYNSRLLPLLQRLSRFFVVTHMHANNGSPVELWSGVSVPEVIEFTFVNRSICGNFEATTKVFPTQLDVPNVKNLPEHDIRHLVNG
jgi:hypothetical protein